MAKNTTFPLTVAAAREAAAEAAGRSYGAECAYAKALNDEFGGLSIAWYKVEHGAKGAEADMVHAEKQAYFKLLHAKHPSGKYPNPSVPWARVRKYAQEEMRESTGADAADAEGDGDTVGDVGAKHTRSLSLRYVEELSALFKAGRRAEKEGIIQKREADALVHIASALGALGIDLATL